ncbi:YecA family protein [Rhodococcus opacus]|uniref:YecA family protein n=1 Tax=Rhodococcus opacus TaxID=37919 RepID=UPI0005C25A85|nr:SEC-C metal-binding domain-containing protein [Rhodococcus opacus]
MIADHDELLDAALGLLRERGPLSDRELTVALADAGWGGVDELIEYVEEFDAPLLGILPDDRKVALDVLLAGRVLTHRLTAEEIAADVVEPDDYGSLLHLASGEPDVDGFEVVFLDDEANELAARGGESANWSDDEVLALPRGTLAHRSPGDLLAMIATDSGVRLDFVGGPVADAPELALRLTRRLRESVVIDLEEEVWHLLVDDPAAFTVPGLPLADIVEAAGFDRSGQLVAPRGFDFEAYGRDLMVGVYGDELGVPRDAALAVATLVSLATALEEDGEEDIQATFFARPELYTALADPAVMEVAAQELFDLDIDPEVLLLTAQRLLASGPREVKAAASWIAGRATEMQGFPTQAEDHYGHALVLDGAFDLALFDLARFASDRGDAVRGLSLLNRMAAGDAEPLHAVLEHFQPTPRPGLGRNHPCWCGSGRKYKTCHLGKGDHALSERAAWLYQKAKLHAQELGWRDQIVEYAEIRSEFWAGDAALFQALEDPLVTDVALFEGGAFADFVECRGDLLPPDEFALARQWQEVERSLHEVEEVRPGEGLTLRDLRTGDRRDIREVTASRMLHVGNMICARVVPAGDTWQIFGGIEPISQDRRPSLLAALDDETTDPADLVEILSERFAPVSG